jgi:hypothetical protein
MKKISIRVGFSDYDITLDDNIGDRVIEEISKDLSIYSDNEMKTLLSAYLKKCHQLIEIETKLSKLTERI